MFEGKYEHIETIQYFTIALLNKGGYLPDGNLAIFITENLDDDDKIRIKIYDGVDEEGNPNIEMTQVPFKVMKDLWFPIGYATRVEIKKLGEGGVEEEVEGLIQEKSIEINLIDEEEEEREEEGEGEVVPE